MAATAGCNAVKFQKRTVDVVYSAEELSKPRESPFGATNGDLKRALEFGVQEYEEIDAYCKALGIPWLASCWDEQALEALRPFALPCFKIASAFLPTTDCFEKTRELGKPVILSTGMSTLEEIDHAVDILGKRDLILFMPAALIRRAMRN